MKEKKRSLRFSDRRHAKSGVVSMVMAGIGWIVFIVLCVYSSSTGGNAEESAGILGIFGAILAAAGVVNAYHGFHEKEVSYAMPMIGIVLNGSLFVIYFILYLMGVAVI